MDIFKEHKSFIFQSKPKDKEKTLKIFDLDMKLLAYYRRENIWKPYYEPTHESGHMQSRSIDIYLMNSNGTLIGEINENPPVWAVKPKIFEIYNEKKELVGLVRDERGTWDFSSDWKLKDHGNRLIGSMVGNQKKKDYKIQSPQGQVLAKCYRDSSLNKNFYRIDIFAYDVDVFLILCYVIVLDLAKSRMILRSASLFGNSKKDRMKPKTGLVIGGGLMVAGFFIWVLGILINYSPYYEVFDNGHLFVNVIGIFSYLPMFFGFAILIFFYLFRRE